jgi:four helix bundle protein
LNQVTARAAAKDADRSRFLEIARGSTLECAACLDVLVVRKHISADEVAPQKEQLVRIVNMLMGLLKRFSNRADFLREEEGLYVVDHDHEQEQDHETKS